MLSSTCQELVAVARISSIYHLGAFLLLQVSDALFILTVLFYTGNSFALLGCRFLHLDDL